MARFDPKRTTSFQEPLARSYVEWDVQRARAAVVLADSGILHQAALLAETMRADDRVGASLTTRVAGLLGLPLAFSPVDDSPRAAEVADALAEDWPLIAQGLTEVAIWGVWFGVALVRLDWRQKDRMVPVLDPWSPGWLVLRDGRWIIRLPDRELEPQPGLWWVWAQGGAKWPWRGGAWRRCLVPWLAKTYAVQDWARYNEVHGSPVRVGTAPQGSSAEERERFARDLQELGAVTSLVLPEGWEMSLLQADASGWETFQAQVEWADRAIAVAILGQHLTTEVKGASLAAARVHDLVRADLIQADAEALSSGLRDGVLRWWAEVNFGDASLAPYPIWDTTHPDEGRARAQRLAELGRAVLMWAQAGVPLDVAAIAEAEGVPLKSPAAPVRARQVRLASGDAPERARGFVAGQMYADTVADRAAEQASDLIDADLRAVLRAVQQATDYEDLRQRLLSVFADMDPIALAELAERAMLMADLAGRWAVREDAPEVAGGGSSEG